MAYFDAGAEFDRQLSTLVSKGYPELAGLSRDEFVARLTPLRDAAVASAFSDPPSRGWVPFVLVVTGDLVDLAAAMALTSLPGGAAHGFVDRLFGPAGDRGLPAAARAGRTGRRRRTSRWTWSVASSSATWRRRRPCRHLPGAGVRR